MFEAQEKGQLEQKVKVVLAFAFNCIPFCAADNPYFRAAFGSKMDGLHRLTLRKELGMSRLFGFSNIV